MGKRNFHGLLRFGLVLLGLVATYAVIFQLLMAYESREYSWLAGLYWTLTTMSTLGYGDIVFVSDAGRLFSVIVLMSGIIFLLVLLPFTFIELFYEPWTQARAVGRIPTAVSKTMEGHVILTFYGPVASALITKLTQFNYPYVVVLPEREEVMRLVDQGKSAIYGELDDPDTYRHAGVERAAMVATTRSDIVNTAVAFTVSGVTSRIPVIATARDEASVEVLRLAGCSRLLDLTALMGESLARRAIGGEQFSHVIGRIDDLVIAEVAAARTTLVGMSYSEAQRLTSVSIVGFWVRGDFEVGQPESTVEAASVLVMAGSSAQLKEFDVGYQSVDNHPGSAPVVIIGGGRVGRATSAALHKRGIDYRIVELEKERIREPEKYVLGSGANREDLHAAGFAEAPTVIITTHDDETNMFLTLFCRLLRPDIQIICRSTLERNVAGLHRAGSDIVMSSASMGSNALFNLLQRSDLLMVAEGLDVFKVPVPRELVGKTLAAANIRHQTQCSVIGIDTSDSTTTNPGPDSVLPDDGEIVLIGTPAGETEFLKRYPS